MFALGVGGMVDHIASMTEHRWTHVQTPTATTLHGVALGESGAVFEK